MEAAEVSVRTERTNFEGWPEESEKMGIWVAAECGFVFVAGEVMMAERKADLQEARKFVGKKAGGGHGGCAAQNCLRRLRRR